MSAGRRGIAVTVASGLLVTCLAASATAVSSAPTLDAEGLYSQPRANCLQFPDASGDASTNPVSAALMDKDDDLDITGVVYKTQSDNIQVFIPVKELDVAPTSKGGAVFDTHTYSTGFTVGTKAVKLTASDTGPAKATVGSTASNVLHPTASFDIPHSNVVFTVSRVELATVAGGQVSALTGLTAQSASGSSKGLPGFTADSAAPTTSAQKVYTVGDNTCFTPLPATLTLTSSDPVYTDVATVTAILKTADGQAVANAPVTLYAPGRDAMVSQTNSLGYAAFFLRVAVPAGSWTATGTFAGTPYVGPAQVTVPFVVSPESTVLSALASRGAVTATLTDNDQTVIGKRYVTFTVAGRRFNVLTDYNGHAVKSGLAKGTVVTVSFPGVPNLYSAARTLKIAAK